jgi:YwiC-like protein
MPRRRRRAPFHTHRLGLSTLVEGRGVQRAWTDDDGQTSATRATPGFERVTASTTPRRGTAPVRARATWRTVALPDEHGGWSLTAEPALLGLLVAPSWAGAALGAAALVAFVARTPLKLVLVDRRRHRWLPRTGLALRIAAAELAVLSVLATVASLRSGLEWLVPMGLAVPLVAVGLWFDSRSRGRRLVPELCGAVGIGAFAPAIALAGGADSHLAAGLWLVLAARSIAAIPFVRVEITRLRHGQGPVATSDRAQVAGAIVALGAAGVDARLVAGSVAVLVAAALQSWWVRRPPMPAKVLGLRELMLGLMVVGTTAAGVLAS